jgi:glycosyltransferase involved in cell wall biosynthesis
MVSPTPTHPVNAGNRARIVALVRQLRSLGHDVHYAVMPTTEGDDAAMAAFFGADRFHRMPWQPTAALTSRVAMARRKAAALFGSERAWMWHLDDWIDPGLLPGLRALEARHGFDAVCVEYVFLTRAFDAFPAATLRILDTHDRFALRHRTYLAAGQTPQWFSTTEAEEAAGLRRADLVLAIQDREADLFRAQLAAHPARAGERDPRVTTVGHLLDLDAVVEVPDTASAVVIGSANPLNVEATRWFVDQVMPRVQARHADFTLYLAGDVGNGIADAPGIVKLGRVAHVNDAFGAAAITVNPVRGGTGINIKLLEALAAGVPNLSTESGLRGLEAHRDTAIRVVPDTDAPAFAAAVLDLLADRDGARALARAGRALAEAWNRTQSAALVDALA